MIKKKVLFLIVLLIINISLNAEDAFIIRENTNFAWANNSIALDDGVVSIWADTKTSLWNVYVQKVDAAGNKLWNNGEPLLLDEYIDPSSGPINAVITSDNCVIFLWKDRISGNGFRLYAQKMNSAGEILWSQNNEILIDNTFFIQPYIIANDIGGTYIFYNGGDLGGVIGLNIDANANDLWSANPDPLFVDISLKGIVSDNNGGVIINYIEYSGDENLMATRINSNREILWNEIVAISLPNNYHPEITSVGNSNVIIRWRCDDAVIGQCIDVDGNQYWGTEGMVINDEASYVYLTGCGENFMMAYFVEDTQPDEYIFKIQKFDLNANALWNDATVLDYNWCNDFTITSTLDEGCYITWFWNSNIKAQFIDTNGNKLWGEDGILLGTDYSSEWSRGVVQIDELNDQIFCTWQLIKDGRSHLRYQCLDQTGNILLPGDGIDIQSGMQSGVYDYLLIGNDDSSYYLWEDCRYGQMRLFAQRVSPNGANYFSESGIALTNSASNNQLNFVAKAIPNGGVAVTWNEVKENEEFIRVRWQILNPDGTLLTFYGNDITTDVVNDQTNPQIDIVDECIIITWLENDQLKAQKLVDSAPVWGTNGSLLIESGNTDYYQLAGNYFFFKYLDGYYFQRIDENGNLTNGWPYPGVNATITTYYLEDMYEYSGDLVYTWRKNDAGIKDYGFQILNAEGVFTFPDDGFTIFDDVSFYNHDFLFDGCINLIHEADEGCNILMERYDLQGNAIWNGVTIQNSDYFNDLNSTKMGDNFLVTWYTNFNESTNTYMMQIIDSDGIPLPSTLTGDEFKVFSDQCYYQLASVTDADAAILFHRGFEEGSETTFYSSGLVSYLINSNDVPITENEIVTAAEIQLSNFPNPFNPTTEIRFQLSDSNEIESAEIAIYNLKGQKTKTIPVILSEVEGRGNEFSVIWNGTDDNEKQVSSGVYFYKLNVNGLTKASKKCLLLK
jgi:hypothetical protein